MTEKYFVLVGSDGDGVSFDVLTKEELEKRLNSEYWGSDRTYASQVSGDFDLDYFKDILIIRGVEVAPVEKKTVTEWVVE